MNENSTKEKTKEYFNKIFPNDPNSYDDKQKFNMFEDKNPPDTLWVDELNYYAETGSGLWLINTTYYVCEVPKEVQTFILFEINWDDNYERYDRRILNFTNKFNNHRDAANYMMKEFTKPWLEPDNGFNDEDREFAKTYQ